MTIPAPRRPRIEPLARPDGKPALNIFNTLAHNRPLMKQFMAFGGHLLQEGEIDARSRELIILRVGWNCGAEYEFAQHMVIGRAAGVSDAEIQKITDRDDRGWSVQDLALLDASDELCSENSVSDATWNALASRFNESQLLELLLLVGFYRMVSGMLNGVGVALEPKVAGWPRDAGDHRIAPRS